MCTKRTDSCLFFCCHRNPTKVYIKFNKKNTDRQMLVVTKHMILLRHLKLECTCTATEKNIHAGYSSFKGFPLDVFQLLLSQSLCTKKKFNRIFHQVIFPTDVKEYKSACVQSVCHKLARLKLEPIL